MDTGTSLLEGLHQFPGDRTRWHILADWLADENDPREEVHRLHLQLQGSPWGTGNENAKFRLLQLLSSGVGPYMPTRANSLGTEFVLIPPGAFWMGSPPDEDGRYSDEGPLHRVRITRPFYMSRYPVTQREYSKIIGKNPSEFSRNGPRGYRVRDLETEQFPVENVTWYEALTFCHKLSSLKTEKSARREYRLPTEAEWEYACRAGASSEPYHFHTVLGSVWANYEDSQIERPTPVGSYPPNAWGLFDMQGNIWEWINDWMEVHYYRNSPERDPTGPILGDARGFRGGAWMSEARLCRAACRSANPPGFRAHYLGFRLVMNWP